MVQKLSLSVIPPSCRPRKLQLKFNSGGAKLFRPHSPLLSLSLSRRHAFFLHSSLATTPIKLQDAIDDRGGHRRLVFGGRRGSFRVCGGRRPSRSSPLVFCLTGAILSSRFSSLATLPSSSAVIVASGGWHSGSRLAVLACLLVAGGGGALPLPSP